MSHQRSHWLSLFIILIGMLGACTQRPSFEVVEKKGEEVEASDRSETYEEERTPSSSIRSKYIKCMHTFNQMMDKVERIADAQSGDRQGDWMGPKAQPYWKQAQDQLSLCKRINEESL